MEIVALFDGYHRVVFITLKGFYCFSFERIASYILQKQSINKTSVYLKQILKEIDKTNVQIQTCELSPHDSHHPKWVLHTYMSFFLGNHMITASAWYVWSFINNYCTTLFAGLLNSRCCLGLCRPLLTPLFFCLLIKIPHLSKAKASTTWK